jgi:hypothetical protein
MPSIEFCTLLLALVAAIIGGGYQVAKANYYYFIGIISILNPLLIFACGISVGQASSLESSWKSSLLATSIAMGIIVFSLTIIKDILNPEK